MMGSYSVADDVAFLPSSALLIPLNRVLFPAFVLAKENLKELKRIFLLAQGLQALVGIPASIGLILVAGDVVHVLLGEKWLIAIPFIQVLAVVRIIAAITSSGGYLLTALGEFRAVAAFAWSRVSLFAFAAYFLFPEADAMGVAVLRAAFVVVALALFAFWVRHALPALRLSEMAVSVSRPLAAAGIMSAAVLSLAKFVSLPFVAALVIKVVVGALTYIAVVALLWKACGRPTGPETYLLDKLRRLRS
jgi:O-antigen/teichoic acid export membrane protein